MKQTAVEWLCNEWLYIDQEFDLMLIDKKIYWEKLRAVQEQAKEMEKQHLCYFYVKGADAELNNPYVTNIEFYNKTFKSE